MTKMRGDLFSQFVEIEEPRPDNVINVVGSPKEVEKQVNHLLLDGYTIGSTLLPWTEQNSNVQLFVQQVIKYEDDDNVRHVTPRSAN